MAKRGMEVVRLDNASYGKGKKIMKSMKKDLW